jgi:hypothetical protein
MSDTAISTQQVQRLLREDAQPGDFLMQMGSGSANEPRVPERTMARLEPVRAGWFRFRSPIRNPSIKLRVYRETGDEKVDVAGVKKYESWAKKRFGEGNINVARKALKADERMVELLGDYYIRFTPIRGRHESKYETNDPEVAAYIRGRLPEFEGMYEEVAPLMVTLDDGTEIPMVPATPEARQKMAAMAAGG